MRVFYHFDYCYSNKNLIEVKINSYFLQAYAMLMNFNKVCSGPDVRCEISIKRFLLKIFLNLCNHFSVYFNIKCKGYVLHIFLSDMVYV